MNGPSVGWGGGGGSFSGGTVPGATVFSSDVTVGGNLLVTGTATFSTTATATGQFLGKDGTKTSPSYSFTNDPDSGIYSKGANNVGFSAGDTAVFDYTATAFNTAVAILPTGGVALGAVAAANLWSNVFLSGGVVWTDGAGARDTSIERSAAGVIGFYSGTATALGASLALASDKVINFSSTTDPDGSKDVGLARSGVGVARITNGSTGQATLEALTFRGLNSYSAFIDGASSGITFASGNVIQWGNSAGAFSAFGSGDTALIRAAPGIVAVSDSSTGAGGFQPARSANAATIQILDISELLTLSTSGVTTDTSANLLPANAFILSVSYKVTTAISGGGVTTISVGDATTATRFTAATAVATTPVIGWNHLQGSVSTDATGPVQVAAAKIRVTADATPTQGAIRLSVKYYLIAAPTS